MSEELFAKLFSRRLNYFLEKKHISKAELARLVNVSPGSVTGWTNGTMIPRMDKVDAICKAFNCTREDLIVEKTEEEYYDEETAKMAQEIFDNNDLRVLFSAARDAKPEDLKIVHDMLIALKKREKDED